MPTKHSKHTKGNSGRKVATFPSRITASCVSRVSLAYPSREKWSHHKCLPASNLEFHHAGLDCLPKAAFLESQAAFHLERFHFGLEVLQTSRTWHQKAVTAYRDWGQAELQTLLKGSPSPASQILAPLRQQARRVLGAEENRLLLEYSV